MGTFDGVAFGDGRDGARLSQNEENAQAARSTMARSASGDFGDRPCEMQCFLGGTGPLGFAGTDPGKCRTGPFEVAAANDSQEVLKGFYNSFAILLQIFCNLFAIPLQLETAFLLSFPPVGAQAP